MQRGEWLGLSCNKLCLVELIRESCLLILPPQYLLKACTFSCCLSPSDLLWKCHIPAALSMACHDERTGRNRPSAGSNLLQQQSNNNISKDEVVRLEKYICAYHISFYTVPTVTHTVPGILPDRWMYIWMLRSITEEPTLNPKRQI